MTIKEIAKIAGVSPSTVSKIMNQKDDSISVETRERVLQVVKEYNYVPYLSTATSGQKTMVLGVLLRCVATQGSELEGFLQAAQENGYSCLVRSSFSSPEQELKNVSALCANRVDAVIWEPLSRESLQAARHFADSEIPVFTIGTGDPNAFQLPFEEMGCRMTEALIDRKHRRIACVLGREPWNVAFLEGYRRALFSHQLPLEDSLIFHEIDELLLYQINSRSVSAVLLSNSTMALEFYHLLRCLHYRVPEDVSLIALHSDNHPMPAQPELSTCTVQWRAFGQDLCRQLIARIEKREAPAPALSRQIQLDNLSTVACCEERNIPRIVVVGSINIDTYLDVSQLPHSGMTVSTNTSSIYPGGKGINQSIGVSKLGQRVSLIGNVGSDLAAGQIYDALTQYGIDASCVNRCPDTDTGRAYIFVDSSGNSIISILAGANSRLSPGDIRRAEPQFEGCGYCLIQSEIPIDAVLEACRAAHRHQVRTILKPSACEHFPRELYGEIDILVPNENELKALCPQLDTMEDRVDFLRAAGVRTVITTLGARGCYVKTEGWSRAFPAAVFKTVDNTGASDAFISALAAYLLQGYQLEQAVRVATYAAGFAISREGVVPALIDRSSLESYIRQAEPALLR